MLYLLLDAGSDTYALEAARVAEVVPCAALKRAPGTPPSVAGILNYHGTPVPVLDCGELLANLPSPLKFSTRIAICRVDFGGCDRLLGLLAENVTRVQKLSPTDFVGAGAVAASSPAGKVAADGPRLIQLLEPSAAISPDLMESLTREDAA